VLHLWNSRGKFASHKIELLGLGKQNPFHLISITDRFSKVDALKLGIMRIDLAVDIPKVADFVFSFEMFESFLRGGRINTGSWTRTCAKWGWGKWKQLNFGKRPNLIRIYDKTAERLNEL